LLAGGYRVVAIDRRSHGLSESPAFGQRMARHGKDLDDVLSALDLTDAVLVGGSSWSFCATCDRPSLAVVDSSWDDSRRAFTDAANWFVRTAALVGDRWDEPGLGEWDVRALVGHTSRSMLTVEAYLAQSAATVEIPSALGYYGATRALAAGPAVAERGREAGRMLGADPAAAVAEIAARVIALVAVQDPASLLTTIAGGMRLGDYLPTRTFELAVHTSDLATALGAPLDVPPAAAAQALGLITELAVADGRAGELLLATTGRSSLPVGWSVL
jgi:uncharacterized protein (TIGR03083 family)